MNTLKSEKNLWNLLIFFKDVRRSCGCERTNLVFWGSIYFEVIAAVFVNV